MLSARMGFLAALAAAGFGLGVWFMWGQVSDARESADTARQQVNTLSKTVEEYAKTLQDVQDRQLLTEGLISARIEQDNRMQEQLSQLRADMKGVINSDPINQAWSNQPLPDAIADRLWGPSNTDAPGADNHPGEGARKPNPGQAGTGTRKPDQ